MLESAAAVLLAYLMGTFPSAYVVGRLYAGLDIREHGSRNPGALNTFRQVGAKAGLAVLVVDGGKGAASVVVAEALGAHEYAVYLAALAVTLGHNFTPMLGFKGGKGGAAVFGISAAMLWGMTAVSLGFGLVVLAATRQVVWSITGAFVALNILTMATGQPVEMIALCLLLSFIVAATHLYRGRGHLLPDIRQRQWRRFMRAE